MSTPKIRVFDKVIPDSILGLEVCSLIFRSLLSTGCVVLICFFSTSPRRMIAFYASLNKPAPNKSCRKYQG